MNIKKPLDKNTNGDLDVFNKAVTKTEEMGDNNSWNGAIFGFIKARQEGLLNLVWRKRLEHKDDIAEKEVEDSKNEKNWATSEEDPLFIKWCEERRDHFNTINNPVKERRLEDDAPVTKGEPEGSINNPVKERRLESDAPVTKGEPEGPINNPAKEKGLENDAPVTKGEPDKSTMDLPLCGLRCKEEEDDAPVKKEELDGTNYGLLLSRQRRKVREDDIPVVKVEPDE